MKLLLIVAAAFASGFAFGQFAQKSDTQTEIELGRSEYEWIVKSGLRSRNEAYCRRVERIFAQLVAAMPERLYPYQVVVIASNEVNANCLPGGYVTVYEGLIASMPDDEELAFVLAHELGHGAKRHWARQLRKTQSDIAVAILLAGISNTQVNDGAIALRAIGHERHSEREADAFGAELYLRAGYDSSKVADGMRVLLDRERKLGGSHTPEYLRTHPETEKRIDSIEATARKLHEAGLRPVEGSAPEVSMEAMFGKIPTLAPTLCPWVSVEPGEEWEYEIQTSNATSRYRVRCVGLATIGLTPVARMEINVGASPIPYQTIIDGDRVWRRNRPGKPDSAWIADMAFPIEGAIGEAGKKKVEYGALEDVETPAGRFEKCLRVLVSDESGRKLTEWYAPGIGLVRRTNEAAGITELLISVKRP